VLCSTHCRADRTGARHSHSPTPKPTRAGARGSSSAGCSCVVTRTWLGPAETVRVVSDRGLTLRGLCGLLIADR
jgi:hypothetical protein